MSNPTPQAELPKKTCGFRLSGLDVAVIVLAIVLTFGTRPWLAELSWLFVIVAGHFFLFCNVFRIHRWYELAWSGLFIINVSTWYVMDALNWLGVLLVQCPITLVLILMSFVQRDYHGVCWRLAPHPRVPDVEQPSKGI